MYSFIISSRIYFGIAVAAVVAVVVAAVAVDAVVVAAVAVSADIAESAKTYSAGSALAAVVAIAETPPDELSLQTIVSRDLAAIYLLFLVASKLLEIALELPVVEVYGKAPVEKSFPAIRPGI